MKRYIKSQNYVNFDDEIQTLIDEFDPYIADVDVDADFYEKGYGWKSALINDKNSDFSEWADIKIDDEGDLVYWEWNRQIFFDRSYTDDMNIKRILEDDIVVERTYDVLLRYVETGVVDE